MSHLETDDNVPGREHALLLRATDRETALAHHVAFTWQVITRLAQGDFELPVAAVHDWLTLRREDEVTRWS